mgnify:CR=1 FL=1
MKTLPEHIKDLEKAKIPMDIKPMLATLGHKPLNEKGWLYELKWDGFRAISYLNKGKVEVRSRNNKSFNDKFYPITNALSKLKINAVLDGEIIVVNDQGLPDFSALQTWRSEADGNLAYYVFDILWLDGYNLMQAPLIQRKNILNQVDISGEMIRISEGFDVSGKDFFELAEKMGLEGLIAKHKDGLYKPGNRSKEWQKIKTQKHQEAVIAGYTRNENSPKLFSALILGVYEHGKLVPTIPVGTGFNKKMQEIIMEKLKPLQTNKCPFPGEVPDFNKASRFRPNPPRAEVIWVKPKLVAEISYQTVSSDGAYRHPSFRGLREDKAIADINIENPENQISLNKKDTTLKNRFFSAPLKKERKTLLNPKDETQVRNIGGHDLKFTNLSKIYWPKEGITKRDLINYYFQVAPYILPYLKDRPQTLNRFPHGINGESFYQKNVKGKVPDWIETFYYYSETDLREKEFFICTNEASLLYSINLGCVELNPWSSRAQTPDNPDWCIIDLDPDKNTFNQVIEAANVTKEILDAIKIPGYCKTSGATGLHIYIPLGAKYTYEESKEFGRALAKVIHAQIPEFSSIERLTSKRKGKIYIDFLQNRPQATVAAPYTLRPRLGATVSMPLHWEEVKKGLKISDFTIFNAIGRLKEQGDIFKGVLGKGINISKALKILTNISAK